jgi:hypothetical protein
MWPAAPPALTRRCGGTDLGEFASGGPRAGWRAAPQLLHGGGCPGSAIAFGSSIVLPRANEAGSEHRPVHRQRSKVSACFLG